MTYKHKADREKRANSEKVMKTDSYHVMWNIKGRNKNNKTKSKVLGDCANVNASLLKTQTTTANEKTDMKQKWI